MGKNCDVKKEGRLVKIKKVLTPNPGLFRGPEPIRTAVRGFADLCLVVGQLAIGQLDSEGEN